MTALDMNKIEAKMELQAKKQYKDVIFVQSKYQLISIYRQILDRIRDKIERGLENAYKT